MTEQDFYDLIIAELGGNLIEVELGQPDVTAAYNKAKATFIQKGNNNFDEQYVALPVTPDQRDYDLSGLGVDIDTIANIITPGFEGGYTHNLFTLATINDIFSGIINNTDASLVTYMMTLQQINFLNQVTDSYPSFRYNKISKTLHLNKTPVISTTWLLHCWANLTDDQYRDLLWIQEYAKAEAKIILGLAYRKFSSVTGPAGTVSLDGDALIRDGQQEKKDLLQQIADYTDGDAAYGYITFG